MSARLSLSLFLLAASITLGRAAPVTPPDGVEKKSASAIAGPAEAKSSDIPAAKTPPSTPGPVAATSESLPSKSPDAPPAAAPATETPKPGILTAVKAKGPPPVSKAPASPVPLSPRFQQIRQKMSALFDARNAPPAAPDSRANPFRPAGAAPIAPIPVVEGTAPMPVAVNNDLVSLQQAVATLRVKGTVQLGKTLQLIINSGPGKERAYKEGDILSVSLAPDSVNLRVRVITRNSVTLTLNDAEMVLKF